MRAQNNVAHVELLRGVARLVPRYAVTATYRNQERSIQKKSSVFWQKRVRPRKYFITMTFGKLLFITRFRMRYAIYIPPYDKNLALNLAMVAYGNRQSAIMFARANNSDLFRALKHLMETRLKLCSSPKNDDVKPVLTNNPHTKPKFLHSSKNPNLHKIILTGLLHCFAYSFGLYS